MIQTLGKSFDEVIKRDKNFGRLLTKIKKAYDEYLTKLSCQSQRTVSENMTPEKELKMVVPTQDQSTNTAA
jgi:hypothetical protein